MSRPGSDPPTGSVFAIKLRLRHNVLGNGKRMSSSNDGPSNPQKSETRLVTAGRDTKGQRGFVNPAVFHGSTVLYPTADDLHAHRAETTTLLSVLKAGDHVLVTDNVYRPSRNRLR